MKRDKYTIEFRKIGWQAYKLYKSYYSAQTRDYAMSNLRAMYPDTHFRAGVEEKKTKKLWLP